MKKNFFKIIILVLILAITGCAGKGTGQRDYIALLQEDVAFLNNNTDFRSLESRAENIVMDILSSGEMIASHDINMIFNVLRDYEEELYKLKHKVNTKEAKKYIDTFISEINVYNDLMKELAKSFKSIYEDNLDKTQYKEMLEKVMESIQSMEERSISISKERQSIEDEINKLLSSK